MMIAKKPTVANTVHNKLVPDHNQPKAVVVSHAKMSYDTGKSNNTDTKSVE